MEPETLSSLRGTYGQKTSSERDSNLGRATDQGHRGSSKPAPISYRNDLAAPVSGTTEAVFTECSRRSQELTMVLASQLRAGMAIAFENQTYRVVAAEYHPGQGKMGGVTHTRLQNLDTRTFRELGFRAELKLQDLPVERQTMEFLYADGDQCCFMNPEDYEQTEVAGSIIGTRSAFLEAGMKLPVDFVGGRPVHVLFPDMVEVKIADTAPAMHQQADSAFKPAKLANGIEVMVPQFVKSGDMIRLDLENMRYMDRARLDARAKNA